MDPKTNPVHHAQDAVLAGMLLSIMTSGAAHSQGLWAKLGWFMASYVVLNPVFPGTKPLNYLSFSLLSKEYLTYLPNAIRTALPAASSHTGRQKPVLLNDLVTYITKLYEERAKRAHTTSLNFMGYFSKASICTSLLVKATKDSKAGEKCVWVPWKMLKTSFSLELLLQK